MKSRFGNAWRQLACLAVAYAALSPSWSGQTRVSEMVFGVAWVSFVLGIFVTKPADRTTPQTS